MKSALSAMRRGELRDVLTRDPQAWDAEDALRAGAMKRFEAASKPYEATSSFEAAHAASVKDIEFNVTGSATMCARWRT